jgi:hypothetical protein
MSFLSPGWILAAGVASAVVAVMHLIAWQLPRAFPLPTARFVPDEPARRAARTIRPSDLLLLALRVAMLMAVGFALAGPVFRATPAGTARVIAVGRSADTAAIRERLALIPRGDQTVFVVFDTATSLASDEGAALSLAADSGAHQSLSTGLLAAIREARVLARDYENVGITLVSTFDRRAFDAATAGVRAMWPDSIHIERLPLAAEIEAVSSVDIAGETEDPVVAGIRLAEANGLVRGSTRVNRSTLGVDDSASAAAGTAVVIWPRIPRDDGQRVDGVHAEGATAIGHFIRASLPDSGTVVARWVDGTAAAVERRVGQGCIRTVGFDVPDVGDFALSAGFQRIASALLAPCGGREPARVASDSLIAALAGEPPQPTTVRMPDERATANRLAAALMTLAVLLSISELMLRRRPPARRGLELAP